MSSITFDWTQVPTCAPKCSIFNRSVETCTTPLGINKLCFCLRTDLKPLRQSGSICYADSICNEGDADGIAQWYQNAYHDTWANLTSTTTSSSAAITTFITTTAKTTFKTTTANATAMQSTVPSTTTDIHTPTQIILSYPRQQSFSNGSVAGIVIGCSLAAIALIVTGFWFHRKHRKKRKSIAELGVDAGPNILTDGALYEKEGLGTREHRRSELPTEANAVELDSHEVMAEIDQTGRRGDEIS